MNCIAPGYIKVDTGTSALPYDFETTLVNNTPWGRLDTPADIAPAALFLASRAADYVTGEALSVDGWAFAGRMSHARRRPGADGDPGWPRGPAGPTFKELGYQEKLETPTVFKQGGEFQRFFEADARRLAEGVRKVGRVEDKK